MTQLITKHLGRRLAYGLKATPKDTMYFGVDDCAYALKSHGSIIDVNIEELPIRFRYATHKNLSWLEYLLDKTKPILHPLSDLTKPITHKGKTFYPIHKLAITIPETAKVMSSGYENHKYFAIFEVNDDIIRIDFPSDISSMCYRTIEKLLEWHFVLDEPEGTWIDVNSLPQNPYQ